MTRGNCFLLAGPTASGKSAAAAILAREMGAAILSADSMLVYRDMDLGTAKPSDDELAEFKMGGIDVVSPAEDFSVGAWLRASAAFVKTLPADQPIVVVGGTGLYFSGLLRGIDREWVQPPPSYPILDIPRDVLRVRCAKRIDEMFAQGWIEEVRSLMEKYPVWSHTASYAIGYAEIKAVLEVGGETAADWDAIKAKILQRTMRLVKHQATWFRHQAVAIPVPASESSAETADAVRAIWRERGPQEIILPD